MAPVRIVESPRFHAVAVCTVNQVFRLRLCQTPVLQRMRATRERRPSATAHEPPSQTRAGNSSSSAAPLNDGSRVAEFYIDTHHQVCHDFQNKRREDAPESSSPARRP